MPAFLSSPFLDISYFLSNFVFVMQAPRALEAPRAVDAELAAADDDAAVQDVGPASTSRAATPPPTSPSLAAIVAERVADGDRVGVDDADTLLEPAGGNESALNVEATVEA